jgi:hypothetical protein
LFDLLDADDNGRIFFLADGVSGMLVHCDFLRRIANGNSYRNIVNFFQLLPDAHLGTDQENLDAILARSLHRAPDIRHGAGVTAQRIYGDSHVPERFPEGRRRDFPILRSAPSKKVTTIVNQEEGIGKTFPHS